MIMAEKNLVEIYETEFRPAYYSGDLDKASELSLKYPGLKSNFSEDKVRGLNFYYSSMLDLKEV